MRTAARTAMLMAILTLISKGFGFIREMVMANFFGTSYITDAYVMAIAIPTMIFGGILGAVSVAYMPIFSKTIEEEGVIKGNEFTSSVLKILAITALISAIIGFILSDQIVAIFASGFKGETAELTSFFLKTTFFYLIFMVTADVLEAFLRYKGVFLPQVAFGLIQNIILISTIIISALTSYHYLVFGYLILYVIRLAIMAAIARKNSFIYTSSHNVSSAVTRIMVLSLPVFIGNSMSQINAFVDKMLASGLPEGSVSALNFGNLLVSMIMGLTITIMTTIIYPKLTQASAQGDSERLGNIISVGMTLIVIIAVPCTLGAMVYSKQIVQIAYERGAFSTLATSMTASAFFYYTIGLLFMSLNTLFAQVYYAKHNMKTPVIFGAIGVIINIVFNLILVKSMAHSGLALATSISAIAGTTMLIAGFRMKYPEIIILKSKLKIAKIIISAIIAVGTSYMVYLQIAMPMDHVLAARLVQFAAAVIVACVVYTGALMVFKVEELKLIKQMINR